MTTATRRRHRSSSGASKKFVQSDEALKGDVEVVQDGKKVDEEPSDNNIAPRAADRVVDNHAEDESDESDDDTQGETDSKKLVLSNQPKVKGHSKEIGNGLTELIPGYVAPLHLDTSALANSKVSLAELRRRATRTDASTRNFVTAPSTAMAKTNFLPSTYAAYSFKQGKKKTPDLTAGKNWFSMVSTEITDQVKTDMAVILNRGALDPKRFYKKSDKFGKHIQVGTVIEGSAEFYSSRLTKKERRADLAQEIMADPESASYAKRKYLKITQARQEATAHFHKKKRKVTKNARRGY